MNTVYLYIPFNVDEQPDELIAMAKRWQTIYQLKEDMKDLFSDGNYHARKIEIVLAGKQALSNVKSGEKIYVLAHGIPNSTDVVNESVYPSNKLSQKDIAERMISDGLPKYTNLTIKLYYCDESNNAEPRAESFTTGLHEAKTEICFDAVETHYYPGVVLQAMHQHSDYPSYHEKAHKSAHVIKSLASASKKELTEFYRDILKHSNAEDFLLHLSSLDKPSLMSIVLRLNPELIKELQTKFEIKDMSQFFQSLPDTSNHETKIFQNIGKPKTIRKRKFHSTRQSVAHKKNNPSQESKISNKKSKKPLTKTNEENESDGKKPKSRRF